VQPRLVLHMFFPVTAAMSLALFTDLAKASPVYVPNITGGTVFADLTNDLPPLTGPTTFVNLTGGTTPSVTPAPLIGTGYTITFSNFSSITPTGCITDEGVVQGLDGCHAVPVAGPASYLTGGFGSATTTTVGSSGNYLSTGFGGQITITFTSPQTMLELLWGSIDGCNETASPSCSPETPGSQGNYLTLNNGTTVTGYEVGTALQSDGFTTFGSQLYGGSGWVQIDTTTPFTTVTLTSLYNSFEAAGIAVADPTPEPASVFLVGTGLGLAALLRRSTLGKRLKKP
jgi:hypothetical protein